MEFLFAGATGLLWQGVVGAMDNREADHAILYSFEAFIHIILPQRQALHYTAILKADTHLHSTKLLHTVFSISIPEAKFVLSSQKVKSVVSTLLDCSPGEGSIIWI